MGLASSLPSDGVMSQCKVDKAPTILPSSALPLRVTYDARAAQSARLVHACSGGVKSVHVNFGKRCLATNLIQPGLLPQSSPRADIIQEPSEHVGTPSPRPPKEMYSGLLAMARR
ncbi:hypothetical protein BIW11_06758 [Tropilaelaps mercedesae]|uniref:Uncharacterized protein n=1 Tax=Tropilaelaps mercedesae TaxID=418985 RepID=A0A1V9XWQ2_9ACAR|nr:hypothetical protein BIW11_06758 [Tropilaelaps mercedesae]